MLANWVEFRVNGMETLQARLEAMTPFLRKNFVRKALYKGGLVVARRAAEPIVVVPVLKAPIYRRGKLIRKPGTLRDAILVRNSKDVTQTGNVGVFVNVKPAQGADRGADSPNDPFYWRFVEFGTKRMRARPFLRTGAKELEGAALRAIETSLGPDIEQLNLPGVLK
jgi:HK97 gp10 family phage protein